VACFWGMQNHQPGSANRAEGVSARSFFSKFSEKEFFRILVSMRCAPSRQDPHAHAWRLGSPLCESSERLVDKHCEARLGPEDNVKS
jgi:hypothetical protein